MTSAGHVGGELMARASGEGRGIVHGRRGIVVCGHRLGSEAGVAAIEAGGSATDAAIAASAVLCVVLGHATSIGGDCFALISGDRSGIPSGLNASGPAPAAATPALFREGMPQRGPLAPVVPGLVRAWEELHRRGGKLAWRRLLEPAIVLAANGFPASEALIARIVEYRESLTADPGCAAFYLPGGRCPEPGETMRQPALARTLQRIAERGADEFYLGETASAVDGFFERSGGIMRSSDLERFRPEWTVPLSCSYRGHRVFAMPPNSLGTLLLMQLVGLSALPSESLAASDFNRLAWQMSALKAAFDLGRGAIADPNCEPSAAERLLGPESASKVQAAVRAAGVELAVPSIGGTACVLTADRNGNAVNLVQSVFNPFGSCVLDPDTGIIFNNRMSGFSAKPGQPNTVEGGKRPAHTLCPVMVTKDDRLRFLLASPGGVSQTLTNVQVLCNLLDRGFDIARAVHEPRWCNTRAGDFLIEPEIPAAAVDALVKAGHRVRQKHDPYFYGSAKAIELLDGSTLAGAADHRREAFAMAC